jgi:hypothetical protein
MLRPHLKIVAVHGETGTIDVDATCSQCKRVVDYELPLDGWNAWLYGQLIQRCFPDMDADRRELLISGLCGTCFDDLFKEETPCPTNVM